MLDPGMRYAMAPVRSWPPGCFLCTTSSTLRELPVAGVNLLSAQDARIEIGGGGAQIRGSGSSGLAAQPQSRRCSECCALWRARHEKTARFPSAHRKQARFSAPQNKRGFLQSTALRLDPPPTVLNSEMAIFGAGATHTVRSCTEKRPSSRPLLLPNRPLSAVYMPYLLNYCAEAT